jgi:hypothetical protein
LAEELELLESALAELVAQGWLRQLTGAEGQVRYAQARPAAE